LVVKAEPGVNFSGPIRIRGRVQSDSPVEKPALATLAGFNATFAHLWLTVATPALKEPPAP
jgi:hypothetical protein